ncbi:MAG TPA: polymer-forming cytoskeletal protein [Phycisphaerales bacterium]|nr:polymer-forming cytoskeletal protein [Phycisphaerales bacterium]
MADSAPNPRTIQCYHCRQRFEIARQAQSTSCPKCSRQLRLEDVVVKTLEAVRKIQTCGKVVVQKKGRIIAQSVEAHLGVHVEGIMEANVVSGGPVTIGSKAQWKGDCAAPSVVIEDGCVITGGYFAFPEDRLGLHVEVKELPKGAVAPPA